MKARSRMSSFFPISLMWLIMATARQRLYFTDCFSTLNEPSLDCAHAQ
jgi:hypothetical protein